MLNHSFNHNISWLVSVSNPEAYWPARKEPMSLQKKWLDTNVVPLLKENSLRIHSFIWNGNPPKEVLVWLHVMHPSMMNCQ